MKNHFTFYLILVVFFCFLSPAAIGQTTRFVSTTGVNSDPASATSWATATSDLQGAINSLTATGGEVWVASGLYKPTSTTNRTISWDFYENINVYGGFVGSETAVSDRPAQNPTLGQLSSTTLSGDIGVINDKSDNSNRLIAYHGTTNFTFYGLIDGFVLTGADGGSGGGAIMVGSTGSLVVSNCYFYQNSSGSGGAISMNSYEVGLVNCVFESNSASGGGGAVFSTLDGTLSYATFISCIFRNNSASEGGAIYALYSLRIRRCLFENNTATTNGGAISTWTSGCNVNARNCSFVNNSAGSGGGAINSYSSPFMSVPAITGCSFQGNSATTGGAIRHNISSGTAVPTISNSVFYNNGGANTIDNGAAITLPWKYNLAEAEVQSVTGITTQAGNLTATTTPFASTVSNELYGCSPAIDAGDPAATNSTAGSTDISLQPRFYNNGRLDIGAYEYQADPTTITLTNPAVSNATVGVGFSQTFTASGGTEPYSYSLLNSSLPTGLTLSTTGVLSGTSTKSGTFTMVLQTTDGMGCGAIGSVYSLTVDPVPPTITGFAASPAIVCVGQATTFTAIIGNVTGSYGFTLTNGSSPISGTTTNSTFSRVITDFVTGTKTYTLIVNDNGSFTTATTTLTINNFSPLTITASPSLTITQGNTITLTASGSNSGETLVFTWPDGSSGATYEDIPASTIAYSLTGLNTSGCLSATSVTITVISPVCYSVIYVTQNGVGYKTEAVGLMPILGLCSRRRSTQRLHAVGKCG
ncbi:hypothetical protein GO730_06670 [Spirosoma sp. HMF3257]|uniref:Dystroglycan-type cadherin-like domain-containing protein n=1 Tax=Spirosoma telluris TaxID=2183553 RepID=A0A327NFJ0_9BACT|nr:hypothetical protein [Spirosoma telluris]RAI74100.1 hypothetical protein HMF3257_06610 [Spirosoma telluris]